MSNQQKPTGMSVSKGDKVHTVVDSEIYNAKVVYVDTKAELVDLMLPTGAWVNGICPMDNLYAGHSDEATTENLPEGTEASKAYYESL